uniref:SET-binding protein n=1 Tax=Knipowitschia caucasica TaxID=637954 RepID=A0AAV2MR50_KNICA
MDSPWLCCGPMGPSTLPQFTILAGLAIEWMEPRDLVGSARPKEAEIQGGRLGPNEDNQEAVGVSLLRRDDAINGAISEGEGVEEQGENLEEQEFSIKEASFKEGSLKLKIQTTKRTKKPPKNLENYICPPEIRMTIRPPMGEKSGRQSRTSGAGARASKDDEKGPPRKRTYERQFRMPEQREGSLLQLLGDPSPPKHQPRAAPLPHSQQTPQFNRHGLTQDWLTSSVPSTILNHPSQPEPPKTTLDQTQAFSRSAHSPSPQRSLTPDLQLPVVTDASILNLTSLSRGRGLQEVSEQLFGNIKKRYGRRESQKMPANPQCGETSWEKQPGKDSPAHSEERSKYRHEHIDSSHLRQDGDSTEKHQSGPPDPKVAHKNDPQKNETHLTSNRDGSGWKLSPPRLLANSPSHLSEGASVKEVTLSPISESHSEETIPSDSGIGTDNNSTSDQAEKGPASRRRYSFDLCGYETPEAAALDASSRDRRTHCELQVTSADNFLTQQEKKQKHHRRKRKCLQTRDHLHFLAELEEVVLKLQQLRVSHRRYTCYPQHPYPSIFRLNFHHFYPMTYDSYPCEPSPYMRRSVELKAKRRRGRPAKASEPITSKLPFVQGYGYPLAGGNYYAAPYAMPYAPPMGLGYFSPAPPFYLPHPSLGPGPSSPFMRPAVPPPKAYHSTGHSNLSNHQPGTKLHGAAGSMQGPSVRTESLGNSNAGGLRLHKRKHKHKHKHKDEPLLSPRNHQDLGGLFSGAKANARMNMISDRRDFSQGLSKPLEKQKNSAPSFGAFGDDSTQQPSHPLLYNQFHLCQTGQPIKSFLNSYSSDSQQPETAHDLFLGSQRECNGRNKKSRFNLFGDQGLTSFHATTQQQQSKCVRSSLTGAAGKRRYKRREVEQIQNNARRMHSLNFEHVQKILRAKRLQRQAKTGNNVIKRRPGRPRKQPLESVVANELEQGLDLLSESRADGRTLGMPVLERCDDLPGRPSVRPSLIPEALEFSNHDSIAATIETVVHQATSVPPAKVGKRRGRAHSRDDLWAPSSQ